MSLWNRIFGTSPATETPAGTDKREKLYQALLAYEVESIEAMEMVDRIEGMIREVQFRTPYPEDE